MRREFEEMPGQRILLVEDEVLIAMSLEFELRKAGYSVSEIVATGEDAVKSAADCEPDLIIMDICLAGKIDGIEAARQIREKANIPIVFVTGYHDERRHEQAQNLKPLGYFVKPLLLNKLKPVIDAVN